MVLAAGCRMEKDSELSQETSQAWNVTCVGYRQLVKYEGRHKRCQDMWLSCMIMPNNINLNLYLVHCQKCIALKVFNLHKQILISLFTGVVHKLELLG